MGEETTRLRHEIEQTREDLTRDVDLLADKTSPSRIVERRVQRTRRGISGLRDRVMGTVHEHTPSRTSGSRPGTGSGWGYGAGSGAMSGTTEHARDAAEHARDAASTVKQQAEGNPLAAGVVAFGIGWLVSSLLPATEKEKEAARRATEQAKAHGGPVMEQAKQAASEVGGSLKESAQEKAQQVKEHAQDAAQTVKAEGTSAASTVQESAATPAHEI